VKKALAKSGSTLKVERFQVVVAVSICIVKCTLARIKTGMEEIILQQDRNIPAAVKASTCVCVCVLLQRACIQFALQTFLLSSALELGMPRASRQRSTCTRADHQARCYNGASIVFYGRHLCKLVKAAHCSSTAHREVMKR
jgi:hypothetical protein